MQNYTREKFNQFVQAIATLNGLSVAAVMSKFNVTPSVQQTMEGKIQESSEFLKAINIIGVTEQQGSKLGLGITGPIASTTDTTTQEREPIDPTTLDEIGYMCTQTNYDTFIPYSKLDAWAGHPQFARLVNQAIIQRIALDRIMIGFNGTSRAATSNRATNPLLQDVNKGWLQKIRDAGSAHWVKETDSGTNQVKYGASVEFKTLDAIVVDAVNNLVEPWYREDNQLVAVLGRNLLADKYFPLVNTVQAPTEQKAAYDLLVSQKRVGNLQAVSVPYFPANAILITRLDNLSIYYQRGAQRRSVIDNPKRDRIETYQSSNDAFVVEDYGCTALIENITAV